MLVHTNTVCVLRHWCVQTQWMGFKCKALSECCFLNNYLHSKQGANESLRNPQQTTVVVSIF
jgi:hypothetical protein